MYSELELFIWTKGGDTGCVLYHGSVKCLHLYMCYFLMIVIKQPNYNFLAIPHKLYILQMTVVGNKSMDFANLCQCKLNSFANKNVCKQDDLMLSQVKWIINWGKFTKRRQRSLYIYLQNFHFKFKLHDTELLVGPGHISEMGVRAYKRSNADICVKFLDPPPPSQQRSALKKKMSSKPRRLCTILYHGRDLCGFRTLALDNEKKCEHLSSVNMVLKILLLSTVLYIFKDIKENGTVLL